ncbi:hypothetical protein PS862_02682 [Pseudomonas fluorescens]|uniref:Uncharacterized protein n=1 Tax=Pseudomonas fluorescens TaxID=294 RepID=A0A5E6TGI2_PSEFL|nr:hypothetical protein PS639_02853 [Pseudomonas fluorescens]VVO97793.1 hypothetical protein PS862_02682 [Pseudomonas fluorescens]
MYTTRLNHFFSDFLSLRRCVKENGVMRHASCIRLRPNNKHQRGYDNWAKELGSPNQAFTLGLQRCGKLPDQNGVLGYQPDNNEQAERAEQALKRRAALARSLELSTALHPNIWLDGVWHKSRIKCVPRGVSEIGRYPRPSLAGLANLDRPGRLPPRSSHRCVAPTTVA